MLTDAVALKEDQLQFISDAAGDVPAETPRGFGLYYQDTRYLSRFDLTINGLVPLSLSHSMSKHYIATFQLINPGLVLPEGRQVKQQTISIRRSRFISGEAFYERIGFLNCNQFPIDLDIVLGFDADFRDMFAVRGFAAQQVAGEVGATVGRDAICFSYQGRDQKRRSTEITFSLAPDEIVPHEVHYRLQLHPQQPESIVVRVQPQIGQARPCSSDFDAELERLAASYQEWDRSSTAISTDNEQFDAGVLRASRYDIRSLLEETPQGLVPDAGIPWYAVPFGRDALLTALQTLTYNPAIAEGTLRFLAAHQGRVVDQYREEEPGKIMHELRRGELAELGEVPHTPYYGTVDATPLFLVLLTETMDWLGSKQLYQDLLPAATRALEWIDRYGDLDGDGYVEYIAHRSGGVINQGWKDSIDAVQYEDGTRALPPVALVEVQGYVYQAKMGMARLLRQHGDSTLAAKLEQEAAALKERFNRDFWMADEGYYALALDREKQQIRSITSNAGHCLWSDICDPEKAEAVAARLLAPDMFSGWGVRTLSSSSPNYNPMSYHNGSVWPHDTAIIALGLRRQGYAEAAVRLVQAVIEAGFRFSDARLPELFCGFSRDQRFNSRPAAYVVSCSPQAWAAGSTFMLLQAILDIHPDLANHTVTVDPVLPDLFARIDLQNIRLGTGRVDLLVERVGDEVQARVTSREPSREPATITR